MIFGCGFREPVFSRGIKWERWCGSAEDGFVGFDFWGAVEEVFEFGEHAEGVGLVEVDVEEFFGGVAGEEEEEVCVGGGTVEAVVEDAGFGAGDGDAVAEFAFEVGGFAGLGAKADGDDVLLVGGHGKLKTQNAKHKTLVGEGVTNRRGS